MRYYVQYPIFFDCNLRCNYCFHTHEYIEGNYGGPGFTMQEYVDWRDTHLVDAEEIVMHLHGGEPSTTLNSAYVQALLRTATVERVDLLTNGLGERDAYERLLQDPARYKRVGLTFHRKMIVNNHDLLRRFEETAEWVRDQGVPVYIKELLFTDQREEIEMARAMWTARGFDFKVQDFKGNVRGEDFTEFTRYTQHDMDHVIDQEYVHTGRECGCLPDHKNVIIRGGWMAGDVLACWIDPTVVGSIQENTYDPGYRITLKPEEGRLDVEGVTKKYRGTYGRDRYYESLKEAG